MRSRLPIPLRTLAALSLLLAVLAGCSTGHAYREPQPAVPPAWHAPLPHSGSGSSLANWWRQLDDPSLDKLIEWAERGSPTLVQAWAGIQRARATLAGTE